MERKARFARNFLESLGGLESGQFLLFYVDKIVDACWRLLNEIVSSKYDGVFYTSADVSYINRDYLMGS